VRIIPVCVVASALVAICATGAQARPRDQVMSNVYRCAAIADSRVWLDCYYGAAQPARVALGLAPVPAGQAALVERPPAGGDPHDLTVRDAVVGEASRCNGIGQERGWLDCYYAAAQPMRALLGLSVQASSKAVVAAPASVSLPKGDWLTGSERKLVSPMTAYSFDLRGLFTVTLANGQTWRQMPGDVHHPHWIKPAGSYVVSLSRGALGSVNFTVQGQPGLYKVEQLH
jgi:hypothetical protein